MPGLLAGKLPSHKGRGPLVFPDAGKGARHWSARWARRKAMNKILPMAALLLGALVVLRGSAQQGDTGQELARFEGNWDLVAIEADGTKVPDEVVKGSKLTFKGNTFTFQGGEVSRNGTFKIDPSRKPAAIDITVALGEGGGNGVQPAIYSFRDADTLLICGSQPGKDRPTEFDTKGKMQTTLMTLRRQR
jgi:uncharacterized protein (TIGR03067 family)